MAHLSTKKQKLDRGTSPPPDGWRKVHLHRREAEMSRPKKQKRRSRSSLAGRLILVTQRSWYIATALAAAFETKGAQTVLMKDANVAVASVYLPGLSAAVLDGSSDALCTRLSEYDIPYVLYSARDEITGACAGALLIRKPAPAAE